MDFFDERIFAALKDSKPKSYTALLGEVGFSHNTLQQHLQQLTAKSLVLRDKVADSGSGGPKFAYRIAPRAKKQVTAALEDPTVELVAIPFSRLRHVCRFEKGGYCKEIKKSCAPQICPQIRK